MLGHLGEEAADLVIHFVDGALSVKEVQSADERRKQHRADGEGNARACAVALAHRRGRDEAHCKINQTGHQSNDGCVGKLRLDVVDVVALRAGRRHDGGIRNGADVVTVHSARKHGGHREEEQTFAGRRAHNCGGNGDQHAEGTPRGTRRKGQKASDDEEHEGDDAKRHGIRRDVCLHERLGVQGAVEHRLTGFVKTFALGAHDAAEGPRKGKDQDGGDHGLEAVHDGLHAHLEGDRLGAEVEHDGDDQRHEGAHCKRAARVAVAKRFESVGGLELGAKHAGIPIVEETVVDHCADATNDQGNDGEHEVDDLALDLVIRFHVLGGEVGFAREKVALGSGDFFVALHLKEVQTEKHRDHHKGDGQKRVHVERDGFDESDDAAIRIARDRRRPRGNRRDDANRRRRGVNEVSEFCVADLVLIRHGTHCVADGKAVEIVVNEDQSAEAHGGKLRALLGFDLTGSPFAVSLGAARLDHQNREDAEDNEEDQNAAVAAQLTAHRDEQVADRLDRVAAREEHSARENTCEKRKINLLRHKREHDRDDCGHECPKSTYHSFLLTRQRR